MRILVNAVSSKYKLVLDHIPGLDFRHWLSWFSSSINAWALSCDRALARSVVASLRASMTGDGLKSCDPGAVFGHTTMVTGLFTSRIRAVF